MMAFLAGLKKWAWIIGAGLVMALYAAFKVMKGQRDDARYAVKKYKFQIKQHKAVDENLAEVDQTFSHRAATRQQEKQNEPEKVPDRLRNNNRF